MFSFPDCYAAKFNPLQLGNESLEGGVSLEHLITCVPSITVVTAQNGFKVIKWINNKPPAPNSGRNINKSLDFIGDFSFIVLLKHHLWCGYFNSLANWYLLEYCKSISHLNLAHCQLHIIIFCHSEPWIHRCKSPVGNPQLIQFSREIIDLLKSQPLCIMAISKFIPSYHHHFAKQCRVSDYGFSKLLELLEAVPHVLQVL